MIPSLLTEIYYISRVKRINIYVQNATNLKDLTVRTYPAKNTFTIPNNSAIINRFTGIAEGTFNVSLPYADSLTTSSNISMLVGLRTIIPGSAQNILMEVEMFQSTFSSILSQLYYFPSATAIMVAMNGNNMFYYTDVPPNSINQNINSYYQPGNLRTTANNGSNSI